MIRAIVCVVTFSVLTSISSSANAQKKEKNQEKLDGTWTIVSAEFDGSEAKCELKKGEKFVFNGKKYKFESKAYPEEGTFTVDAEKKTKEINFVDTKEKKSHGIYEEDGEELKLCIWHGERPAHFKSGKSAILVSLKRHKN